MRKDIEKVSELEILSESPEAGVYIVATRDGRQIFVTGHPEYDPLTLKNEYIEIKIGAWKSRYLNIISLTVIPASLL